MRQSSEANLSDQRDEEYNFDEKKYVDGNRNKLVDVSYFHSNLHKIRHHMLRSSPGGFSF